MSELRRKLVWLPPFLLGTVGAASAELTGGLLLYGGPGLLRSLTVVLATEMLALALGLASSRNLDPGDLGAVRRRWLLALLAFAGAAGYAAAWALGDAFSAAPLAQGLGLALLGGFPLFAVGSILGAMTAVEGGVGAAVGAPAALGAAVGVTATGLLGVPSLEPTSVFLFCVVAVSAAALVHGWQIDGRVVVRVLAEDRSEAPHLRLEERVRGDPGERGRLVSVDGWPAGGISEGGEPLLPWERTAAEILSRDWAGAGRILVVGAAGGGLLRALETAPGQRDPVVIEPWDRIRNLQRWEGWGGWEPRSRIEPEWSPADAGSRFEAVVVSLRLLPGGGAVVGGGLTVLESVAEARSPGGILILGGVDLGPDGTAADTVQWISRQRWSPPRLTLLRPPTDTGRSSDSLFREDEGSGGGLVLGGSKEAVDAGERTVETDWSTGP